ncbi:MAG: VanZ family protein [Candidatus Tectomicrobia bacterium]|nr:VanZ family protein [Candidatus Tectomicrobia bacterium]
MPVLWVPIRDGIGRPAPLILSTLTVLGGAWVLWKVLAVRENRTPLRGLALGGCALIFGFFIWKLENPVEEVHFFEYGFLSYLAFHTLRSTRETQGIWTRRAWTLALNFAVGLADEGIQSLLPNRFGDIRDVGFNLLAGLLGLVVTELLLSGRARETAVETPR